MNKLPSKNYGFSLLEVLISLVIMSVGMMGLMGLKVIAIKGENESHFRHEASLAMMDMADRMRVNKAGVDAGDYEKNGGVLITPEPSKNCNSGTCEADDLAIFDMYRVALKLSKAIPQSKISITCPGDDCATIPAVPEGVDAAGSPVAAVPEIVRVHTIEVTWKTRKEESEDRTINDVFNAGDYHIRKISMDVTP